MPPDDLQNGTTPAIDSGKHNLIVMGVSSRPGDQLSFGPTAAALLEKQSAR
jgi:hypothetical protein